MRRQCCVPMATELRAVVPTARRAQSSFRSLYTREALFGVGGATLLLLFIAIHNSWDSVAYHVFVAKANMSNEHRDDTK